MKQGTTIRVSSKSYRALVRARGVLETIHLRRLSFDDAVYLSTNFTYEVLNNLTVQAAEGKIVVATSEDGILHFLGPDGSPKLPQKILHSLAELVDELSKTPPRSSM